MAITPFVFAPFGTPGTGGEQSSTELSFTRNFDITKPAVMVFFAHGHDTTLRNNVVAKQKVLEQLEKAGMNAVLVAPQLAYNQASSSPGRFAEAGFVQKFFDEAAQKLAQMHDEKKYNSARPMPETMNTFRNMPIMVVSYSGGYGAANAVIEESMRQMPRVGLDQRGNITEQPSSLNQRIKGAVLLDTLYGGGEIYRRFATQPHRPFVVSSYIPNPKNDLPRMTNQALQSYFSAHGQLSHTALTPTRNVRIFQSGTGEHMTLVQDELTRSLNYIPGYRHTAPAGDQPAPAPTNIARNDVVMHRQPISSA